MSLTADALQPYLVGNLFRLNEVPTFNLPDLITSTGKQGFYLTIVPPQDAIEIEFHDATYLATAVAGDAMRLATASYLTLRTIAEETESPHTVGWGIIKLYYAAFYAGHCILRLLGKSCSYMTSEHVMSLRAIASASGMVLPKVLEPGLYHYEINLRQTGFTIKRQRKIGTHESFWWIFGQYCESLTEQVLMGHLTPDDARSVFSKLAELREVLRTDGIVRTSWLSVVRNSVQ